MSVQIVETSPEQSNQTFIVSLDGVDFIVRLLWNTRAGRYFMTVSDAANDALITGRKVCADMPWASHETLDGIPAGQLWIRRPDDTGTDPGLRDLGASAFVMYVEEASVT